MLVLRSAGLCWRGRILMPCARLLRAGLGRRARDDLVYLDHPIAKLLLPLRSLTEDLRAWILAIDHVFDLAAGALPQRTWHEFLHAEQRRFGREHLVAAGSGLRVVDVLAGFVGLVLMNARSLQLVIDRLALE